MTRRFGGGGRSDAAAAYRSKVSLRAICLIGVGRRATDATQFGAAAASGGAALRGGTKPLTDRATGQRESYNGESVSDNIAGERREHRSRDKAESDMKYFRTRGRDG